MGSKVKRKMHVGLGLLFMLALLCFGKESFRAARDAISVWAHAYVPAMLPFFVVLPALTNGESGAVFAHLFGTFMRKCFACPPKTAGAMLIGLIAGSPAGSIALCNLCESDIDRGALSRSALLCCGLSPIFLGTAVGIGMLGSAEAGAILVRGQLAATLLSGLIFRIAWQSDNAPPPQKDPPPSNSSATDAGLIAIGVCSHMVLYGVLSAILNALIPGDFFGMMMPLIEVAGGSAKIASMDATLELKIVLIALSSGMGGLSIFAQNMTHLSKIGIPWRRLAVGKLAQGVLCATCCGLQIRFDPGITQTGGALFLWEKAAMLSGTALALTLIGLWLFRPRHATPPRL